MKKVTYSIIVAVLMIPVSLLALDMVRSPHADPVFEAIHQGDRNTVLKHLQQGYDPNTKDTEEGSAVSYAAKCGRLQILKDLVENGGTINLQALRASRAQCPIDILWGDAGPGPTGNTFAYLFWEKGYFWRFTPIPVIMLAGIILLVGAVRKRTKQANKTLHGIVASAPNREN